MHRDMWLPSSRAVLSLMQSLDELGGSLAEELFDFVEIEP